MHGWAQDRIGVHYSRMADDLVSELLRFLDASPTPYHAVARVVHALGRAGFREVREGETWSLSPGDKVYLTRADASIAAFILGQQAPHDAGFRLIGAHTDSPNLRLKPLPSLSRYGYQQLGVETYGGVLLSTWLDRDLSLAGRLVVDREGSLCTELVDVQLPIARIPNLAIHLNRTVNTEGLKLNPQNHLTPIIGMAQGNSEQSFEGQLCEWLGNGDPLLAPEQVLGFDLCLYDVQPATLAGIRSEFINGARLDNLLGCYSGLRALLATASQPTPFTRGLVLYDHEEVGSRSSHGADSTLLEQALARIAHGAEGAVHDAFARSMSRSFLISCDTAHAVHPNYSEMHEPNHRPLLGGGPVIKRHASQSYATDAHSAARFKQWCRNADVSPQDFVTRSDLGCGSTIGPISAGRLGLATIDIGHPLLSMHSVREMGAINDVVSMHNVLNSYYSS